MTEVQPEPSPLSRLVLFIVSLSIAGSLLAGVHYGTMDPPQKGAVPAPANLEIPGDIPWGDGTSPPALDQPEAVPVRQ